MRMAKLMRKASPAAVQFIIARAKLIGDLDIERLHQVSGDRFSLGAKADRHASVAHPTQQIVGLRLQLRDRRFDDHRRHAVPAKRHAQFVEQALLKARAVEPLPQAFLALAAGCYRVQFLLRDSLAFANALQVKPFRIDLAAQFALLYDLRFQRNDIRLDLFQIMRVRKLRLPQGFHLRLCASSLILRFGQIELGKFELFLLAIVSA